MTEAMEMRDALARIDELQLRYIAALDDKDMNAWLATFCPRDDASYLFTTRENVEANLPMGMMLDDCRARLEDRVTFISKIWSGTFQDYRMRHFVQRLTQQQDGSHWRVRSNFRVDCTPIGRDQRVESISGVYEDIVDLSGETALFVAKQAVADESVLPRYLVYPL